MIPPLYIRFVIGDFFCLCVTVFIINLDFKYETRHNKYVQRAG